MEYIPNTASLMIDYLFTLLYLLLLLNVIGDFWVLNRLPSWVKPIYQSLRLVAWPFKRPFQGIFNAKVDLSSLAALLTIHYIFAPLIHSLI
jgi:hypothetical protein